MNGAGFNRSPNTHFLVPGYSALEYVDDSQDESQSLCWQDFGSQESTTQCCGSAVYTVDVQQGLL